MLGGKCWAKKLPDFGGQLRAVCVTLWLLRYPESGYENTYSKNHVMMVP